jgi:hypothetical protein
VLLDVQQHAVEALRIALGGVCWHGAMLPPRVPRCLIGFALCAGQAGGPPLPGAVLIGVP